MPYAYDPDAAITYSGVDSGAIDEGTFALQEEEFLLVHRCRRSAKVGETRREIGQIVTRGVSSIYTVEATPRCLFRADIDQQLEFSIEATALALAGLADFHPGLGLDAYALAFINGSATELPFGFTGGEWVYMDPEQDCAAGDMAEVSFRVVREFAELRDDWVPETGAGDYTLIPQQASIPIDNTSLLNALLNDIFNGTAAFSTSPFTVTLYDGDPATTGNAITEEWTPPSGWTVRRAGAVFTEDILDNDEITWVSSATERTAAYVRFSRNGYHTDAQLATPLTIPADAGVRAPAGVFPLVLAWPMDGAAITALAGPGSWLAMYYCGGTRSNFIATLFDVSAYDADPSDGGVLLTTFTAAPTAAYFTVSGTTLTFANLPNIATNSSGSTWSIEYLQITSNTGPNVIWFKEAHTATVANAATLSLNGAPILDIG